MDNIITAVFADGQTQTVAAEPLYQWAYGQKLQFEGLDLPQAYQVDFSNFEFCGESIPQIGGVDGVNVPVEVLATGAPVYAFVWLQDATGGKTVYRVTINVIPRPVPDLDTPNPEEESAIAEAIAALNDAVAAAETAETDAAASAADSAAAAQDAAASAVLAESWAVGDTGTRDCENQSNAKFWAQVAQQGAEQAEMSADSAANSAAAAGVYASDAHEDASNAAQSKEDAEQAKVDAAQSASTAASSAATATTKASEASASASAASGSASQAATSATNAGASATAAAASATAAAGSASTANTKAGEAASSATAAANAQTAAETAQGAAEDAQTAAEAVLASIPEDYTELAEDVGDLKSAINNELGITTEYYVENGTWLKPTNAYNVTIGIFQVNPSTQKQIALNISKPHSQVGAYWSLGYVFLLNASSGVPVRTGKTVIYEWQVDAEGTVRDGDFIDVPPQAIGVAFVVSERQADSSPIAHRKADYEGYRFTVKSKLYPDYKNAVSGEKINLGLQTWTRSSLMIVDYALDGHALQGMDIHNNTLFCGYDEGTIKTYDLSTLAAISSFPVGSSGASNHMATLIFGTQFFSDNQNYPALYISGDLTNYCAYVESVTERSAILKQKINFNLTTHKQESGSMCVIDNENSKIYYLQRKYSSIASVDNQLYCCVFNLPNITDGDTVDGILVVNLTDADVLDSFWFENYKPYYQDAYILKDKIYLLYGIRTTTTGDGKRGIAVYDFDGKQLSNVDLSKITIAEPEGITVYNGLMFISLNTSGYNIINLLFS